MIVCNGVPKNGTHALLKAVELLGVPVRWRNIQGAELHHLPHGQLPYAHKRTGEFMRGELSADDRLIHIIRNPKNAFISWMRMQGLPLTTGMIMARLQNHEESGSYIQSYEPFHGWLTDPHALVVRYEELISDNGETIKKIAEYLGVKYQEDAFENLPGHTMTWNPQHSDYKTLDAWNEDVEAIWQKLGGNELSERLGYDR